MRVVWDCGTLDGLAAMVRALVECIAFVGGSGWKQIAFYITSCCVDFYHDFI